MEKLLSVCMIVKDEEDVLERCLKSIMDFADEIIIVDTGSTDSSKEIAQKYTEHLYDFKWINDFSAARNESIRHATGKWILVMDADEYLNQEDIQRVRLFLQEETSNTPMLFSVSVVSFVGESLQAGNITEAPIARLFPNHNGIRYHRPIHEQPVNEHGEPLPSAPSPITLFHTGYIREVIEKKQKLKRNQEIFTTLKKNSGFTPYDHFTVGNEFAAKADLKKALYSYERAFQKVTPYHPWKYNCAYEIWNIYIKLDRYHDAWQLNENIFKPVNTFPEYNCFQGVMYEQLGLLDEAKASYLQAFHSANQLSERETKFWLVNPSFGSSIPLSRLAYIASLEQNLQDIIYYQTKQLQGNPNDYSALIRLLEVMLLQESIETIQDFLSKLFPNPTQKDLYMLVSICTSLGQSELSSNYYTQLEDHSGLRLDLQIKYAILHNDKQRFEAILEEINAPVQQASWLKAIVIGCLVWGSVPIALNIIQSAEIEQVETIELYVKLINNDKFETLNAVQTIAMFDLLSDLFLLKQYEQFDKLVKLNDHSALLDLLANFFYSKNQIDLSVNYYQMLLGRDELSNLSYFNLALLHLNNGLQEDAVAFFERAIEEEPTRKILYVPLIKNCTDATKKEAYKKLFFEHFPQYRKLSFLQQL